ncbi:MAG: lipid-binding SYLF domain-containing protein [Alphaproteobacteria bacterium]|nr:lipid-binding SYLF domain-containing protein [Alphaproteobacteria bacterium]
MGCRAATIAAAFLVGCLALIPACGNADSAADNDRIERAAQVLDRFVNDPANHGLREALKRARGVLIVPMYVRAGIVIGGTGGSGVMMLRRPDGGWNGPAFYDAAAGTLGPQVGVSKSELVMLFMSQRSVERALHGSMQFGADASIAAGPVGAGERGPFADIYTYVRPVGAYAGVSVSTGAVEPDRSENEQFYGSGATAEAILVEGRYNSDRGDKLRRILAQY